MHNFLVSSLFSSLFNCNLSLGFLGGPCVLVLESKPIIWLCSHAVVSLFLLREVERIFPGLLCGTSSKPRFEQSIEFKSWKQTQIPEKQFLEACCLLRE